MNEALELLKSAVAAGRHEEDCAYHMFRAHHMWAPIQHPLWKSAPVCDCWFAKAADLVNRHNINARQNG